jgi:hypothetical protein
LYLKEGVGGSAVVEDSVFGFDDDDQLEWSLRERWVNGWRKAAVM